MHGTSAEIASQDPPVAALFVVSGRTPRQERRPGMLRMDFHELPDSVTMRMEGRFVGDLAEHARMSLARSKVPSSFGVDLSDVTFVDATGEEVLVWFKEVGVKFGR